MKNCKQCNRGKKPHLFGKAKAICKRCDKKNRASKIETMSRADFHKYKASQFRANWRARAKKNGVSYDDIPNTKEIREWLDKQFPYRCCYSGVKLDRYFGADHLEPLVRGGTFKLSNVGLTTTSLNSSKGSMSEYEFRSILVIIDSWEDKGQYLLKRLIASNNQFGRR